MKKIIVFSALIIGLAQTAWALEPIQDSEAFRKYQNRTPTELSKLIYLLDRFNTPETEIQIDGNVYASEKAFPYGKSYLAKSYKKEKAADWLREHCYRTQTNNQIIYIRVPGEDFRPFRDVLIEELERLEKLAL